MPESSQSQQSDPPTYTGIKLEAVRDQIMEHLAPTLTTCSVRSWMDCYTTFKPGDAFLGQVEDALRTGKDAVLGKSGWKKVFESKAKAGVTENHIFADIRTIADKIAQSAIVVNPDLEEQQTTTIEASPNKRTRSEVPSYGVKHDCRGVLSFPHRLDLPLRRRSPREIPRQSYNEGGMLSSMNISDTAMVGEVKMKNDSVSRHQNERQICTGATELQYNDPCRRFVNGFTIEDSMMRLWRFERSNVCVSEEFDFHKDSRTFISFLLYIMFASTSDLGYDDSVRRCAHDDKDIKTGIEYEYRVGDQWYRTQGPPLSETAAFWLTSRATRVWLVREKIFTDATNKGYKLSEETYVLKDAWLYDDATLERDIRDDILLRLELRDKANAADNNPTTYRADAERYFMAYRHDEVVTLPDHSSDLTTMNSKMRKGSFMSDDSRIQPKLAEGSQHTFQLDDSRYPPAGLPRKLPSLSPRRRKHVRTVYEEVCEAISELTDWASFVRCIIDITTALNFMRLAGYVHRDVSPGNCLWHVRSGDRQGKLSDLEYARRYEKSARHEPRMGTPAFMAAEYQDRTFFFNATIVPSKRTSIDEVVIPFFYHFYHDLESVFWLYVWFLHRRLATACIEKIGLSNARKWLARGDMNYLDCTIDGTKARSNLITYGMKSVTAIRDLYHSLYLVYTPDTGCDFLVDGLDIGEVVIQAYKAVMGMKLVQTDPADQTKRWAVDAYDENAYNSIKDILGNVLANIHNMPAGSLPVQKVVPVIQEEDPQVDPGVEVEEPNVR